MRRLRRSAAAAMPGPCVAADRTAQHCVVGLLLGAACCTDGSCGPCRATVARARRDGFSPEVAERSLGRSRVGLVDRCPVCDFPPPPPMLVVPQLPRLDRSEHAESNGHVCRECGKTLGRGRRQFCSDACYVVADRDRARG